MTKYEKQEEALKQFEKQVRGNWFKDHKILMHSKELFLPALLENNPTKPKDVEVLVWGNPNGYGTFWIQYIRTFGTLFVSGDLGEAVYCWGSECSLEWIANCDFSYFAGKCEANEAGKFSIDRKYIVSNNTSSSFSTRSRTSASVRAFAHLIGLKVAFGK